MNVPRLLRPQGNGGGHVDDSKLRAVEQALAQMPHQSMAQVIPAAPDPLSPRVAELVSRAQIDAAKQLGEGLIAAATQARDEAQQLLDSITEWAARHVDSVERTAVTIATAHARQRAFHEVVAKAQAVYEGNEPAPEPAKSNGHDAEGAADV